jgi:acetoacetyl-CoA synthetase
MQRQVSIQEGDVLWRPDAATIESANLTHYMRWLARARSLSFTDYASLWRWSVTHIEAFWRSVWDYFEITASRRADSVLSVRKMPGARWFDGARLNYAENVLKPRADTQPMLIFKREGQPLVAVSRTEMAQRTAALAASLRAWGVRPGDRVVGYLPNIPEAIVAMLAAASVGAVWSSCAPDFGSRSVLDRFTQIEPKVLIAVDGYRYGGKDFDRRGVVAELQAHLPTLERTVLVSYLRTAGNEPSLGNIVRWDDALSRYDAIPNFEQVPFDHPLWVLYSSGTTGLPKPLVHGHGGMLLEHLKSIHLHNDIGPDDRFFWFTSTGWMMWNYMIGSLLTGCAAVLYDGSPAWPDMNTLWKLAADAGVTYFGTSAAFIAACSKAGVQPNAVADLSRIRAIGSTGSPLALSGFEWVYANIHARLALESMSGGTDVCTAFVGGVRVLPIHAGEIQSPELGACVQAFNEAGQPVLNEVGELVVTAPMPSMPVRFWNDPDDVRYRSSYFEHFRGVWRHGDWIKINAHGGCVIYGRSDSTINRQGVRMGTSEIYQSVEAHPEILDSLIIDLELLGRESHMPLFVVLRPEAVLDDALKQRIRLKLKQDVSPRHVPDEIVQIDQVPYTLSGKKMEVPVRRILLGHDVDKAVNRGAMRNPEALAHFIALAPRYSAA